MHLHFVTWNTGKYEQVQEVLGSQIELVQLPLDIPEIQTTSLHEISADKAMKAFEKTWKRVLVEDTGIYFEAFNYFPWALTKFIYESIWIDWMKNLYTWIENKKAYFQCVMSVMWPWMKEPLQFVWEAHGHISFDFLWSIDEDPRLPYDLIFVANGMELPVVKNMEVRKGWMNHRVKAARKVGEWCVNQ